MEVRYSVELYCTFNKWYWESVMTVPEELSYDEVRKRARREYAGGTVRVKNVVRL